MHRNAMLIGILALALTTLACGVNITLPSEAIKIGPQVSDEIIVESLDGETAQLSLKFGAGKLSLSPGSDKLVSGTATYNVAELKPEITVRGDKVVIDQGSFDYQSTGWPNFDDLVNELDLQLGNDPIQLEINAGAFEGDFELGGLNLALLQIFCGASDVNLSFSAPNQTAMNTFRMTTGASAVALTGLANANFTLMDFDGGLGSYTLDFSGELQRDATINIDASLSTVTIIVPQGVHAVVNLDGGLTNVNTSGTWGGSGKQYAQAGDGPTLTFQIGLGAGNLSLRNE